MSQKLKIGMRVSYPRQHTPFKPTKVDQPRVEQTTGRVIWLGTKMFQVQTDCGRLPYLDYNGDFEVLNEHAA